MVEAASKQTNNDSYSNAPQGHGDSEPETETPAGMRGTPGIRKSVS